MKKKISVIGLGYIGLPTAALLAQKKSFIVHGSDISTSRLNELRKLKINLFEKNLNTLIKESIRKKKIFLEKKITSSDFFIICVPTPFYLRNKKYIADLSSVNNAVSKILKVLKKGNTIILESTVPIGTSKKIYEKILKFGFKKNDINFAYCPERVLPGDILNELINNDRVIGGINNKSKFLVSNFYKKFVKSNVYTCDAATAEMSKLAENSYRDVNIAFANELSMICDSQKINTNELITLANKHPRVNILKPGCGVGGHCIAVDTYFLIQNNPKISNLVSASRKVNNYKTKWVEKKIINHIKDFESKNHKNPIIAYLGLGYKANSGDLRESPSLKIAKKLNNKFKILFVDPYVKHIKNFEFVNLDYALNKAQIFFILVNHKHFKTKIYLNALIKKNVINFD